MDNKLFSQYPPPAGTVVEADEISLGPLDGLTVAIIGYGTMGRAQALNLRRSGVDVIVGSRAGSATGNRAAEEGMKVFSVAEASAKGHVVMLMLPDEAVAQVFKLEIEPALRPDAVVGLAHGFAIAFDQITFSGACFLAAPKGQGDMLRDAFASGGGVPGLLAVTENSPPETWDLAAAYAKAVGCVSGGAFVTTFRQECISDQFGEQAVLCGGVVELLKAAFDIMVEGGYGEENAFFECVHELKLITDLLHRHGIDGMRSRISGTASFGGLTRGPRIIDENVRRHMRDVLTEIENGTFAAEFLGQHDDPESGIAALKMKENESNLVQAGHRVLPRLHPEKGSPYDCS